MSTSTGEVTPFGRQKASYVMSPLTLGTANTVYGSVVIATGTFKFPVLTKNTYAKIDLVNDSYLPCAFESAGWEGFFVIRSRRM